MNKLLLLLLFMSVAILVLAQNDSTNKIPSREKEFRLKNGVGFYLLNDIQLNPTYAAYNGNFGACTFAGITMLGKNRIGFNRNIVITIASNQKRTSWKNFALSYEKKEDGLYNAQKIAFSYAPRFRIGKHSTLAAGLEIQYLNLQFYYSGSTMPDMTSNDTPGFYPKSQLPPPQIVRSPLFSFGLMYEQRDLILQCNITNLTSAHLGAYKTSGNGHSYSKIHSLLVAYRARYNRYFACLPSIHYRYIGETFSNRMHMIELGNDLLFIRYKGVNFGALWCNNGSYTIRAGCFPVRRFRLQLSYINRYELSDVLGYAHRTFQVSINYSILPLWPRGNPKF